MVASENDETFPNCCDEWQNGLKGSMTCYSLLFFIFPYYTHSLQALKLFPVVCCHGERFISLCILGLYQVSYRPFFTSKYSFSSGVGYALRPILLIRWTAFQSFILRHNNNNNNNNNCCRASAGSTHILERFEIFWFDGSMVRWFNGSMVQSAR